MGHGRGRRLNTNDFLSQSKKVLVTLIRFICSFFSAARRTNKEAPPRLSGFWVCRRSCRRGLRNSLRSDSPRPFSSVFLATSPPDKGGIGGSCLYFNPFALRALSLYSLTETQGERLRCIPLLPLLRFYEPHPAMLRGMAREDCDTKDFLSQPKKVLVTLICVICSFFSTARRTNQEAPPQLSGFWVRRYGRHRGLRNSLRSDSPRPFSSVFLATSPPDKGGIGGSCLYSNPLALWALPLYSLTETQGERGLTLLLPLLVFLIPLLVATLLSSPLYFALQNRGRRVVPASEMKSDIGLFSLLFCSTP